MKKITLLTSAAALLALCACNAIKGTTTRVSGSSGTVTSAENPKKGTPASTAKTDKNKAKTGTTPDAKAIAGEWVIVSVGQTQISDREEMPYITFDNGRFYGSNGCNILNGSYTLNSRGITFSHIATTMKYCPDVPFEHEINTIIAEGTPYGVAIETIGHESYLSLLSSTGRKLLTARRHNMGFINGQWQVTAINGQPIDDEECNIFFDIAEGKVHGNTGCNYFNGSIFINPDRTNALELSNMGVTRMACPNTAQETAMLVALEETESAIQGTAGRVMLLNKDGKEVMTLRRSEQPADNN